MKKCNIATFMSICNIVSVRERLLTMHKGSMNIQE